MQNRRPEPRWPAAIAVLTVGGLYLALHSELVIGPRWLLPVTIVVLIIPAVLSHRAGFVQASRLLGLVVTTIVTLGMVASLALLIGGLPSRRQRPTELLVSAASLWITNILVFALWYWRLDAGGPSARDSRPTHVEGAFLFPQMTITPNRDRAVATAAWSPAFLDYLFLAFNTSTAFSPADTPPLARWAKGLMMLQSLISLTVLALLAARAVNIL